MTPFELPFGVAILSPVQAVFQEQGGEGELIGLYEWPMVMFFQECCQGWLEKKSKGLAFQTDYLDHKGKGSTQTIIVSLSLLSSMSCCFIRHGDLFNSQNTVYLSLILICMKTAVQSLSEMEMDVICCFLLVGDGLVQPEALNKKAIQIINRVRDKLTGEFHLLSLPQERDCHCWSNFHFVIGI